MDTELKEKDLGDFSDGYHTFNELYLFRLLYNAAFLNSLSKSSDILIQKSRRHYDGELCFGGGWFVVLANLPTGQVTNHYENQYWDYFNIKEVNKIEIEFDGHTSKDVKERLSNFILFSQQ
jgi:hypothetical protein